MITAVIIDDEQHCTERLAGLVNSHFPTEINLQGTADTIENGFALVNRLQPQLVFLDVHIREFTGFDLLDKYLAVPFQVIFVTAFEQYAIKAFKFSAVDYLLKPVDADDLKQAITRVRERLDKQLQTERFELLFQNMRQMNQPVPRIAVPTINGLEIVNVNDIVRCQGDGNYTVIYMTGKKELMVARTLKEFENLLSGYHFFRIHQSHLVNLVFIKSYHKGKGGFVRLEDKTELDVSSRRKDDFLLKLASMK